MRADTTTFAKSIFAQVRALGINSVRSKQVANRIFGGIRYGSYNPYGHSGFEGRETIETIRLELDIGWGQMQTVSVIIDGKLAFTASTNDGVLVNVEATPRQIEMQDELIQLMQAAYAAIDDAYDAYAEAHGHPETDEQCDRRREFSRQDPGVIAANARYDTLRDESLAINPFASGFIVDPDLGESYSNVYKSEYNFRPRGYANVADMRAYLLQDRSDMFDDDEEMMAA